MVNDRKRSWIIGGPVGLALVLLFSLSSASAYGAPDGENHSRGSTVGECSSGKMCGTSCCNNRTDKCCKGSCIGANDRC